MTTLQKALDAAVNHAQYMGMSVVAICDSDGHLTVCPVSRALLEDDQMAPVVVQDAVETLLRARNRSRSNDWPEEKT